MSDTGNDAGQVILADIGGTHIRIGVSQVEGGSISLLEKWPVSDFPSLQDALSGYFAHYPDISTRKIAIATAAWPDENGVWGFAHEGRWHFSKQDLSAQGFELLHICNDFGASSIGAVSMPKSELLCLAGGSGAASKTSLVMGPGTGLGVAYVDRCDDAGVGKNGHYDVRETFGGHMMCPAATYDHVTCLQLMARLWGEKNPPLIAEHVVSGPGLLYMFKALCQMGGYSCPDSVRMDNILGHKTHPVFDLTLKYFSEFLGMVVNQAVLFGHAYGGVYIDGGVIHHLTEHDLFKTDEFLGYFRKGAVPVVQTALDDTPVYVVQDPFIALKGLQHLI